MEQKKVNKIWKPIRRINRFMLLFVGGWSIGLYAYKYPPKTAMWFLGALVFIVLYDIAVSVLIDTLKLQDIISHKALDVDEYEKKHWG